MHELCAACRRVSSHICVGLRLKPALKRTVLQEAAAASGTGDGGVKAVSKAVIQR